MGWRCVRSGTGPPLAAFTLSLGHRWLLRGAIGPARAATPLLSRCTHPIPLATLCRRKLRNSTVLDPVAIPSAPPDPLPCCRCRTRRARAWHLLHGARKSLAEFGQDEHRCRRPTDDPSRKRSAPVPPSHSPSSRDGRGAPRGRRRQARRSAGPRPLQPMNSHGTSALVRCSPSARRYGMRNRTRLLALAVVVAGGGTLASPRAASATYNPPPPLLGPAQYCCCEVTSLNTCGNRCCSPRGCTITASGCTTARL